MTRFYHVVRQILNGARAIDNKIKYMTIGMGIALIHLFFTIAFYLMNVTFLFVYNVGVTVFYFWVSTVIVKKERYTFIFLSCFVEILLHSSIASIMLGWNWGFMIYTIALIPVTFYLTYTLPYFKGSVFAPVTISVMVGVCYVTIKGITDHVPPVYPGSLPKEAHTFFNYFNTMVALCMQLLFSILFALEIRYMQHQLEQENSMLGEIANYDPLTHLLNRRSMNLHLKNALEQAVIMSQPFCLILADIDDFKKVNDTYGHDCGDEILIAVADMISGSVREGDYVCRWGGEEILILLQKDLEVSSQVANRICKDVAANVVHYKEISVSVTLTMGVSRYRAEKTIRSMIEEADQNLYYGKKNGKNQVVCSAQKLDAV